MHCYARELFLTSDNRGTWICILLLPGGNINSIKGLAFGSFCIFLFPNLLHFKSAKAPQIFHTFDITLKISSLQVVGTSDPSNTARHQTHGLFNFKKGRHHVRK